IYGDGLQVRDVLYVDDLVRALLLAWRDAPRLRGQAFNIGGGPENTLSLLELADLLARLEHRPPTLRFDSWRRGDQRYYVSDTGSFRAETGWSPRVGVEEGVRRLREALLERTAAGPRPQPDPDPVPEPDPDPAPLPGAVSAARAR